MSSALAPTFRVVRLNDTDPDPALDLDAMRARVDPADETSPRLLMKYMETRDEAHLRFREGTKPEWFTLKRLPVAYLTGVLDGVYPPADRMRLAFAAGVHRVERADGTVLQCVAKASAAKDERFVLEPGLGGAEIAPAAWVDELCDTFGAELLAELGTVVLTQSRLPRGRRGPFSFWGGTVLTP